MYSVLSIRRDDSASPLDIIEMGSAIQTLVSITLDNPLSVRRISLLPRAPSDNYDLSLTRAKDGVDLYTKFRGIETPSKDFFHSSEMVFTFDNLGGFLLSLSGYLSIRIIG